MCQICEVAAPEVGAGAAPRFAAASATSPALRRAAPINLEAAHSAAAAMLKGVGVQGRRTLIKGGTVLSANLRRTRESRKIRPGLPLHPYDGMSELGWKAAADAGAHMSIAAPIEMHMRHERRRFRTCATSE